tara:strand:- start:619 stop:1062 length:444 start_codon:yes stop_codon:yes gene_type:complete
MMSKTLLPAMEDAFIDNLRKRNKLQGVDVEALENAISIVTDYIVEDFQKNESCNWGEMAMEMVGPLLEEYDVCDNDDIVHDLAQEFMLFLILQDGQDASKNMHLMTTLGSGCRLAYYNTECVWLQDVREAFVEVVELPKTSSLSTCM